MLKGTSITTDAAADVFIEPTCDKCGAPITTGFMCFICPLAEKCEFWPEEPELQEFARAHRW